MTQVAGDLSLVTGLADQVTEVWVRAQETRPYGGGVMLETAGTAPVTNGRVAVSLAPGACVMTVVVAGRPLESVPLVVPEGASASLEACVRAAEAADGVTRDALTELQKSVAASLSQVTGQADRAEKEADRAVAALSAKADKSHKHAIADVNGLQGALDGKAAAAHTHTLAQITDAPDSHTSAATASTLVSRDSAGRFKAAAPSAADDVAVKSTVDAVDAKTGLATAQTNHVVATEAEAKTLDASLPRGHTITVVETGHIYKCS